jgi:hypothetical protein
VFALAMLVSLGMSDAAEAGKKKKDKGGDTPTEEMASEDGGKAAPEEAASEALTIEVTGIADIDNVFQKVVDPINNIQTARMKIDGLTANLSTALGLPEGTPFADALADLKTKAEGNIELAMNEQGMPSLKPGDAVPANVTTAVDALNAGIADATEAMKALSELPNQVKEVVAAAQAITPQTLISSGVKPLEAPKAVKKMGNNLKVVQKAPDEVKALADSMSGLIGELKGTFGKEEG